MIEFWVCLIAYISFGGLVASWLAFKGYEMGSPAHRLTAVAMWPILLAVDAIFFLLIGNDFE